MVNVKNLYRTTLYLPHVRVYKSMVVVDAQWASWDHWSDCSVTCETGVQTRTRTCTAPPPTHNGPGCDGHSSESKDCTFPMCPGMYRFTLQEALKLHGYQAVSGPKSASIS